MQCIKEILESESVDKKVKVYSHVAASADPVAMARGESESGDEN